MEKQLKFDLFISYRREGGEVFGRLLFEMLKNDYNVFFDHESLSTGRFDKKLLDVIRGCNDVLVILSEGCFDRCFNDGDWFMQEINCAIESEKTVIPLMMDGFKMPSKEELVKYPEGIQKLVNYNGYAVSIAHIDSVINKLEKHMVTPKRERVALADKVSEWGEFAKRLETPRYAELLPEEMKAKILRGAINGFLDEWNAKIFTSILDKMSGQVYNVRTKFRYELEIKEDFDFRGLDIDEQKYYEFSESLSYTKKLLKGAPEKNFWISFVTDLDDLDSELRNENFFFSENLLIDKDDHAVLCGLSDEQKVKFYLSTLRTRINVNGKVLTPVEVVINEGGIFARYEMDEEVIGRGDLLDVKIRFSIPQRDGDGYFFASISEPTFSPFIRFSYPEEYYDVTMIPFLNRSLSAKETKVFDGVRELAIEDEWVIPVSGAIFLIKKID